MLRSRRRLQVAPVRSPDDPVWLFSLVRTLVLLGLFLLPVQMRAGTEQPHPHALFQLLLDASDGAIDHHLGHDKDQLDAMSMSVAHHPDAPTFAASVQTASGLALLAMVVSVLLLPLVGRVRIWPPPGQWLGRIPILEPPPPRLASS